MDERYFVQEFKTADGKTRYAIQDSLHPDIHSNHDDVISSANKGYAEDFCLAMNQVHKKYKNVITSEKPKLTIVK